MLNFNVVNFLDGLFLLAIGFIFGKFISTGIIQLSIWEKINLLGLRPPFKITFKIFLQQIFKNWGNNLTARCLAINLITAICFFTFWFRYGTSDVFYYCCIYFLFVEFLLFSWLENLKIPEFIYVGFIVFGSTASYFNMSNSFFISLSFFFFYICFNYIFKKFLLNKIGLILFNNFKFFICIGVWFGVSPTIIIALLSFISTIAITERQNYSRFLAVKSHHANPLMCMSTLVYILFLFPNIL